MVEVVNLKYSVLIVDDRDSWRNLLKEILEKDFIIVTASNIEEALGQIAKASEPFHVMVTDMRLTEEETGNEDGLKLIEYLKKQEGRTNSIVVTGYPTTSSMHKAAFELQVAEYLEKHPADGTSFNYKKFLEEVLKAAKEAEINRNNLVFILMPFAGEYKKFYEEAVKEIVTNIGLDCKRVDDYYGPRSIMGDVFNYIKEAKFILADFSECNRNVCFEVGIAHALEKNVVLLSQKLEDVPSALRHIRCHKYERSLKGKQELTPVLENAIRELSSPKHPLLYKTNKELSSVPNSCLALVPGNKQGKETFETFISEAAKKNGCKSESVNFATELSEIWKHINASEIVIADVSGRDACILYLTGFAYGLGKKIIYLTRDKADIPSDLQEKNFLVYSLHSFEKGIAAQKKLAEFIKYKLEE